MMKTIFGVYFDKKIFRNKMGNVYIFYANFLMEVQINKYCIVFLEILGDFGIMDSKWI